MMNGKTLARSLRAMIDGSTTLRLYTERSADGRTFAEAEGGGYAPKEMRIQEWAIAETEPARAEANVQEFRFDGSKRIAVAGAYLTDAEGGILWAKAFKDPILVGRRGDVIPVRAVMSLGESVITR